MREAPVCDALKARILGKGGGRRAEMPPPNSLRAQLLPTVQNFASDLNKTRNQLSARRYGRFEIAQCRRNRAG